ncbi:MAG: 50S ribosomal protein L11 methyltransferase [Gammaproteobacteria bacterium]
MSAIDFHRAMLGDRVRNRALYRALKQHIVPGRTTVADIGAGTGVLAFMARRLGAREVYLYEYGPILGLAEQLAQDNRIDGLVFLPAHSREVENPPPVDLVVCETLGNFAYEENIIETLADARRFLNPGGRIVPQHIAQFAAPVVSPRFHRELACWGRVGHGLDFARAQRMSMDNMYVRRVRPRDLLGGMASARRWDAVALGRPARSLRRGTVRWEIARAATVHGFALWWDCTLAPGIMLGTAPDGPRTHWEQIYVPMQEPMALARGDALELRMTSDTSGAGAAVAWDVAHRRGGRVMARRGGDILKGDLQWQADLEASDA